MANASVVDVSAAFDRHAKTTKFHELTNSLAEFVYRNRTSMGSSFKRNLPTVYCYIGIFDPLRVIDPTGRWWVAAGFDGAVAAKDLIASRIQEKNERLPDYRASAPENWLLIVNDQFLGHGEVYARPDDLARWTFPFDFEKVLLLILPPGGGGQVMELRPRISGSRQ
jgi:hypothetical protein